MRDREFVNRFCAFRLLGIEKYRGDMDHYLAESLTHMNEMTECELSNLSNRFRLALSNNVQLFDRHAFRKSLIEREGRSVINASLWDVLATGFCDYSEEAVKENADELRFAVCTLLADDSFISSITYSTNDTKQVRHRFVRTTSILREIFGVPAN